MISGENMENFIRKILAQLSTAEKIRLAYGRDNLSIGKLERFTADWAKQNGVKPQPPKNKIDKKVIL